MLNFEYKLLSKVLAHRLKIVLPDLVSKHQTGFMEGRRSMENVRKVIEVMGYSKKLGQKNLLMQIDFAKCFDSIKISALTGALRFFGLGENFIKWVQILFTDFQLTVQNNGKTTPWFAQEVGCHQGCCYSPLGFIVLAEIFSLFLHESSTEHGVDIDKFKLLMSQFADDTDLFLKCTEVAIRSVTNTLGVMKDHLGLQINTDKTACVKMGTHVSDTVICPELNFRWTEGFTDVLGVQVAQTIEGKSVF